MHVIINSEIQIVHVQLSRLQLHMHILNLRKLLRVDFAEHVDLLFLPLKTLVSVLFIQEAQPKYAE